MKQLDGFTAQNYDPEYRAKLIKEISKEFKPDLYWFDGDW